MSARKQLAAWIDAHRMKQKEFAGAADISETHLSNYLSDARDISPDAARRIRDMTGISFEALLEPASKGARCSA